MYNFPQLHEKTVFGPMALLASREAIHILEYRTEHFMMPLRCVSLMFGLLRLADSTGAICSSQITTNLMAYKIQQLKME